jgi:uncharacterized membrane protein YphA (DoxX/SURF4 family)
MNAEVVGHTPVDTQEQVRLVLRLALGLIFFVSAVAKLRDPVSFVDGVLEYRVLPRPLALAYGRLLPVVELSTALLLLSGFIPMVSAGLAVFMLGSFAIAIAINAARGRAPACYCFGESSANHIGWHTLVRDLLLLIPACWLLLTEAANRSPSGLLGASALPLAAVVASTMALSYVLVTEGLELWAVDRQALGRSR